MVAVLSSDLENRPNTKLKMPRNARFKRFCANEKEFPRISEALLHMNTGEIVAASPTLFHSYRYGNFPRDSLAWTLQRSFIYIPQEFSRLGEIERQSPGGSNEQVECKDNPSK